jgi:hypothetical protein
VSIDVVDASGREFYAVSTEFDAARAGAWVREHVLPQLPPPAEQCWKSRSRIREDLYKFLTSRSGNIELWAWYAAYDHVALAQLWGPMPTLPSRIPKFTRDLRQRWEDVGKPKLPSAPDNAHDALADAKHNLERWKVIEEIQRKRGYPL